MVRSIANRVKSLPELEIVKTARRTLRLPQFRQYLKRELPYIKSNEEELDAFTNFIDEFLQYFGKGMAYTHWQYGQCNSYLDIKNNGENFFSAVHDSPHLRLGGPELDLDKLAKDIPVFARITNHRDARGEAIELPLKTLYRLYCGGKLEVRSISGEDKELPLYECFIGLGAHEAFHNYDYIANPQRHKMEQESYQAIKDRKKEARDSGDDAAYEVAYNEYLNHPREKRAQQAAREALAYYNARAVDSPSR